MKRMNMLKKVALCATTLFAALAWAAAPTEADVTQVAQTLVNESLQGLLPDRTVKTAERVVLEGDLGIWAVKLAPSGHLILADSTKYRPLISFSENDFVSPEADTPQYASLLAAAQRVAAAEAADGEDNAAWTVNPYAASLLATSADPSTEGGSITAQPIDTAAWYQFNALAWYVPGGAPCGCVATAQAQGMHGLQWPIYPETTFEANLTYWPTADAAEADRVSEAYRFNPYSKFDYAVMDTVYANLTTNTAANHEVARLTLLNDILSNMVFKNGGASTTTVPPAVITPWMTAPDMRTRANTSVEFTDADKTAIEAAMMAGYSVVCNTPTHAVLAGGYATIDGVPYVRLNYGYATMTDSQNLGTAWYSLNDNNVTTFAITTPTKTVQCDPLPAISSNSPTISWHIPKCYAGDYTTDATSFSVKAIPVAAATDWNSSDFTAGAIAGNTKLLSVSKDTITANLKDEIVNTDPRCYYTVEQLFIPTETSTWTTGYNAENPNGTVEFQILPLGGAWTTLETLTTTSTIAQTTKAISLGTYAGKPCRLRYFIDNSRTSWSNTFAITSISVTATQVVDKNAEVQASTISNDGKGDVTFSRQFFDLTAGTAYVFAVTPTFDSKDEGTTGYCYTRIADGSTYVEEDFATFTVTSPSTEAQSNENMQIEDNFFRYCTYEGTSYIRVNAGEKVTKLDVYSSHLTAFPDEAFTVTSYENGIFDITVDNTKITQTQNDRTNLSLVATTEAGTISSHELSLAFDSTKAVAESEPAAPTPGEDPVEPETPAVELPDPVYTNTLEGDSLLFVDDTAYTATSYDAITDIDGGTNIALYEANKSKDDNGADVAHSANIVKEHTVSGWFKLNETGKTTTLWVVRNDVDSYSGYIVQVTDAGKLKIARASDTDVQDSAIESTDVAVNDTNWHHITISFDWYYKSDAANYQWHRLIPRAYIDGTPISIDEESLGVVCSVNGTARCDYFYIGAGVTAAGITVYGETLSAEQVAAIDRTANLAEVPTVENPLEPIYTNTLGVGATFEAYDGVTYRANAFTATTDIASLGTSTGSFGGIIVPGVHIATHSVSAWFKVAAERSGDVVLWAANNDHADLGGYSVQLTAAGAIQMGRTKANDGSSYENNNSVATADGVIADGNWHYITMTFSWATGNKLTPLLYVDGEAVAFSDTSKTITCGLNGPQSCTNFKIGAGVTAAGLAVYGDVIPADDVFAYYANSNAYLAEPPTATAVTIEDASVYSSKLEWTNGTPTAELAVTITATVDTNIYLEGALAAATMTIAGNKVTFSGETDLTASATTIQSDLDVSGITANLGAVTIAEGKTLTIGANTTLNSLSGGALVIDATVTASDNLLELLRAYNGKVTFKGATTLEYAANSSELIAQFIYESGTHYLKYGRSIQGGLNFATGKGDDDPTIRVKTGATLNMGINDLSGWQGSVAANPAVIRVENGATLNWMTYSTGSTGFFRDRLILDGGATVENAGENYCFILHGEAGTDPAKAQIAILDSGTPVEATFNGIIPVHNYKSGGGGAGETGGSISVGRNATLNVGTLKGENETLRKLGDGTLAVKTAVEGAFTLAVDAGTLAFKVNATPSTTFTGSGTIMADGSTLDLAKDADIEGFSGTFAVANGGILILPATASGSLTVTEGEIVIGNGTAVADAIVVSSGAAATVAADKTWTAPNGVTVNGTIAGSGTIAGNLTLSDGAILDASADALTADSVTYSGAVTIKVPEGEQNWTDGVKVLNTATALPTAYTIKQGDAPLSTVMLVAKTGDGIYAVKPTVPEITIDEEKVAVSDSNLAKIQAAAAAAKVQTVTSIEGAVLVPAAEDIPAKTVDLAGLELFDNVDVAVDNSGKATVSYAFGIKTITVDTTNGKVTVTAKVDKLSEGDATPTFVEDVTVELYKGTTKIGFVTTKSGISEVAITSEKSVLGVLGDAASATNAFTIKATNEQNAQ